MASDPHGPNKQAGFFRKLFSTKHHPSRLPSTSNTPHRIAPRNLPRSLADLPFAATLEQLWADEASEEAAGTLHRECITQLRRVRNLHVPVIVSAGPVSGTIVSLELTLAGFESRGVYHAPTATRIVTHTFGECRQMLKLLASCVKSDDGCDCSATKSRDCAYRAKMRAFLDTCWVHPPVVHGTTMQWGGGDGGVTTGIRKSVVTASLQVILAFARGEYDGGEASDDVKSREVATVGKLPHLGALEEQQVAEEEKCRARLEVAVVVRDFLQLADEP